MRQGLRESHLVEDLHQADDVTALSAAVAIKQILTGLDGKRGLCFGMQGAQSGQVVRGETAIGLPLKFGLKVVLDGDAALEFLQGAAVRGGKHSFNGIHGVCEWIHRS